MSELKEIFQAMREETRVRKQDRYTENAAYFRTNHPFARIDESTKSARLNHPKGGTIVYFLSTNKWQYKAKIRHGKPADFSRWLARQ